MVNQPRTNHSPSSDVPVLRRAAMDFLARREHSHFELQQKLQQKFPDADVELISRALKQLQDDGLQSDQRFCESYIRYRKSRGFGYLHIKRDLLSRQVSPALLDSHLFADDDDWLQIANALVEKKLFDQTDIEFGSKQHRKLLRFLESRGFNGQDIRAVIDWRLKYTSTAVDLESS